MVMMMTSERFLGVQTKEGCLCYCAFVYQASLFCEYGTCSTFVVLLTINYGHRLG